MRKGFGPGSHFVGPVLLFVGVGLIVSGATGFASHLAPPFLLLMAGVGCVVMGQIVSLLGCFHHPAANQALVRTGIGGSKVALDTGITALPHVHAILPVSLEAVRVEAEGTSSLYTRDAGRISISGDVEIRVNRAEEDVLEAARSVGGGVRSSEFIRAWASERLTASLRFSVAEQDLASVARDEKAFISRAAALFAEDMRECGIAVNAVRLVATTAPIAVQTTGETALQSLRASETA